MSPHIFRKDLLKKIDGEGGRSENNRKAITIYKKYNYWKELDLSEPLYSSNFAYDNSHFGHFGLNYFVPEMQSLSLSFKNIKILWGRTVDLPISLQIRNVIMTALNSRCFVNVL